MAASIKYLLETKKVHDRHFIVGPQKVRIGVVTDLVVKCSDVLKAMLCDSEIRERGDVLMPDDHPDAIIIFLKYAYGAADSATLSSNLNNCSAQTVMQVVDLAEKYNVAPLKKIAVNQFDKVHNDINHFFLALHCVVFYNASSLESAVLEVVRKKTQDVLKHAHFLQIHVESLFLILKQDNLNTTEVELLKACLAWARHKGKSQKDFNLRLTLEKPLHYIRLYNLTSEEFLTEVVPTGLLTIQEIIDYSAAVKNKSFTREVPFSNNTQKRGIALVTETLNIIYNCSAVQNRKFSSSYKLHITDKNIKLKSLVFFELNNSSRHILKIVAITLNNISGNLSANWKGTVDMEGNSLQFDQKGLSDIELFTGHTYKLDILFIIGGYVTYYSRNICYGHKFEFGKLYCNGQGHYDYDYENLCSNVQNGNTRCSICIKQIQYTTCN